MVDKLSPEEQLLKLIEGEEKTTEPLSEKTVIGPSSKKEEAAPRSLLEQLRSISKWFFPKAINLKVVNRFLTLISVVLALYLIWEISQTRVSSAEILKELTTGPTAKIKITKPPVLKELMEHTYVVEKRNIFKSIPKKEPEKKRIEEEPEEKPDEEPEKKIPPELDPMMIQELKKKYKLVGIFVMDGKPFATIEKDDGKEAYVMGINDEKRIKGTFSKPGGAVDYSFKIKEIKADTVILIDEKSNKVMNLNLVP